MSVAILVDLLNSQPHGTAGLFPDQLEEPARAEEVLRPFGQPEGVAPTPDRVAAVGRLRATLVDIVAAPDAVGRASGWAELDALTSSVALRQDFSVDGTVELRQIGGDPVVGAISLAVAELVTDGTWNRVRACDNERCRHVFYDTTRSRTQRWHSYETCGNRRNVAAYRARKKAKPDD
ncbi:putative RNA-binding Zn ribbon-like protein [Rhodococcus sp. LBL1]|nr:putative RNA-binding Zn ribbon-like protein [Rhodococcus sp. LBL1]MDH6685425.1 putative RNA-binding Zn ribbon-like protein [Rhodococcus sp. LBL2]